MLPRQPALSLPFFIIVAFLAGCNTPQQRAYNKPAPIPPPQQQTQGKQTSGGNAPTSGEQAPQQAAAQPATKQSSAPPEQNQQAAAAPDCEPEEPIDPDVEITEVPLDEDGNPIEPVAGASNQSDTSAQNCKPAATAESAKQQENSKPQTQQAKQQAQQRAAGAPAGQRAQTGEERSAAANADLDQRLAAFDELMRRAQQAAAQERQAAPGGPMGGAGGLGANQNMPEAKRGAGGQADTASGLGHTPDESGETRPGDYQHTAVGPIPADLPDGRDDDIVARQLREAASKENDPVLREKLWEEYRRYKRGL